MYHKLMIDPLPPINCGEWHVPCALLADCSVSLEGAPINELNRGFREFKTALKNDPLAFGRADVTVISFNSSVQTEVGFRPAAEFEPPALVANGLTSLNGAIIAGLDAIESRKSEYREWGVGYFRPWFFVLTDGAPTDYELESEAKRRLKDAITRKKVTYIPMAIGKNANTNKLREYYPEDMQIKPVLKADAGSFKDAFVWLGNSIAIMSRSDPFATGSIESAPLPGTLTLELE